MSQNNNSQEQQTIKWDPELEKVYQLQRENFHQRQQQLRNGTAPICPGAPYIGATLTLPGVQPSQNTFSEQPKTHE